MQSHWFTQCRKITTIPRTSKNYNGSPKNKDTIQSINQSILPLSCLGVKVESDLGQVDITFPEPTQTLKQPSALTPTYAALLNKLACFYLDWKKSRGMWREATNGRVVCGVCAERTGKNAFQTPWNIPFQTERKRSLSGQKIGKSNYAANTCITEDTKLSKKLYC